MSEHVAPILSVVVLNWNGGQYLSRCFQSLRAQTLQNVQVILLDNGSTDESLVLTRRDYPEVDIIDLGENLGYAEANNRAAARSCAKYLLFLNNDTWLDPNALAALVDAAEAQPDVPILAPQIRTYDNSQLMNVGLGVDVLGFPTLGRVFYADGACLFIRRSVFIELGGFDTQHFIFFDETDLCWRAWLRGYRVGTVPDAIVGHEAGGTVGSSLTSDTGYVTSRRKRRLTHRNQIVNLLKNYSAPTLCVVLPLFAALTAAEILLLLATGQRAAVKESYIPAWTDLWKNRAHIRAMRKLVQGTRTVSDWAVVRRMSWRVTMVSHFFRVGVPTIR